LPLALTTACTADDDASTPADPASNAATPWRGAIADHVQMGASDNAEVVKVLPSGTQAVLAASKARKIALLDFADGTLSAKRERVLFPEDSGEGELTHIDFLPDGKTAAVTRTMPITDADGMQTDCQGALVFVKIEDSDAFGDVVAELPVGPMPDAVDISPDGRWAVVANERDAVSLYGKCAVESLSPSISLVDLSGFPTVREVWRIDLDGATGQEPEQVAFSADSDHVAVVLQDAQQVAFFQVSALANAAAPTVADLQIVTLPNNSLGAEPWPDGAIGFQDASGVDFYAVAGEYNDTLTILDTAGTVVSTVEIDASLIPAEFPRGAEDSPPFRPDSLTRFTHGGKAHVAASLKNSGSVGVWDVSDAAAPKFLQAVKVGKNETAAATEESTVGAEGISAAADGSAIVTANEGESTASLIVLE
jgi:DNA-binding beta-propeller fold protein YncE